MEQGEQRDEEGKRWYISIFMQLILSLAIIFGFIFLIYDEEETHESLFKLPPNLNNYIFTNIYIIIHSTHTHKHT